MNIAVCGYFGMGNFGDELFLRTWQQVLHPHHVVPYMSRIDAGQIDAVIVGGGDLIIPYAYNANYFPPKLLNHPAWVYGVGIVDNYPESTWPEQQLEKYRNWISRAKGLYVRDQRSAELSRKLQLHHHVETVPDMVFAYEEPRYPIHLTTGKRTIGVCVHAYSSFPFDSMARIFADYTAQGYRILLIPVLNQASNPYSDTDACTKLQQLVRHIKPNADLEIAQPEFELELTYSLIQSVDYLITFKLHPAIAAIRGGVPVFCISKMNKVYQLLAQFGMEANYCDASMTEEHIRQELDRFLYQGAAPIRAIAPRVRAVEQASRHSLHRLKKEIEAAVQPR